MPILDLQRRLTQVGVIRLGEQRLSQRGKKYPHKLDTFRVTSPTKALIDAVANLYGGQPREWKDAPGGPQWEVITTVTELPVFVLPQKIDPNMELWGPGFRSRLCDGQTEKMRGKPCFCAADRAQAEAAGRVWVKDPQKHCKPTTRVSVMLADVPSLGTWKVESHGWNAAAELPTLTLAILEQAQRPVPAVLKMVFHEDRKLTFKDGKEQLETFKFAVPHLDFGLLGITPRQSLGGGVDAIVRNAVAGRQAAAAIEAAPADDTKVEPAKLNPEQVISLAELTKSLPQVQKLWREAQADGVFTPEVEKALRARGDALQAEAAKAKQQAKAQPRVEEVVDAEIVDEPDAGQVWNAVIAASPWPSTTELEKQFRIHQGVDMVDANGHQLAAFLSAIKAGEVR